MIKKAYIIFTLGFFLLIAATAQEKVTRPPVPLFQSDELLQIELKADFRKVFLVTDDSTYFPARLSFIDDEGQLKTMDIQIRTRGKTRRKMGVCSFTPLRVNFPKKETAGTPFEGQNVLKLVSHCNKANHNEQNIILEYLIYKAFNVLTDSSFKVRPARIDYIYDDKKGETIQKFAFFIEREKLLAERLLMVERKPDRVRPDRVDPYQACLVDIFQYMIGNADYSIYERHNVIILSDAFGTGQPVAVPYDFDWSGVVLANYAVPNPKINTKDVTVRVYRGIKQEPEILNRSIRRFQEKKEEIYSLFEDFELLDNKEKKRVTRYLDDFYRVIGNERLVRMEFVEKARNVEF
ncbi:MAG: hypothetical protein K0B08_09020 [Bacteroidales bacterium]|nr:hypothetical protein [Bacteroidales bacterium]